MADEKTKEEAGEKTEEKTDDVKIDEAKIAESVRAAVGEQLKDDIAQMLKDQQSDVKEVDIQAAVKDSLRSILGGDKEAETEAEVNPMIRAMLQDTKGFFTDLVSVASNIAKEDIRKESQVEKERRLAADVTLRDRPDITKNNEAQRLLLHMYSLTDEGDKEQDRWEKALKQYDALLEAQGAGKSEDRISKAVGVSTSGGGRESSSAGGKPVDELEAAREEMKERKEAFRKARQGSYYVPQ